MDIFVKIPERQTKWDSCFFHGRPGEKKHKQWEEKEQGETYKTKTFKRDTKDNNGQKET